jgi:hypothetical protein
VWLSDPDDVLVLHIVFFFIAAKRLAECTMRFVHFIRFWLDAGYGRTSRSAADQVTARLRRVESS